MKVARTVAELRLERPGWGKTGLVPTMGYLHEGHLSLLRAARADNESVVMSLFVNPAQFGPREDLSSYPRDIPRDLEMAEAVGCDVVFLPDLEAVYPPGFDTWVEPGVLATRWEAQHRPGHFRGVATVVLKLFTMVQPDRAYFGEKDYQQLLIVEKMVLDLNLPLCIVRCPTVREPSGLALSSRNAYLSPEHRAEAAVLSRALRHGVELAARGIGDVGQLEAAMRRILAEVPAMEVDYLAVVDAANLEPVERLEATARVVAAVQFHGVRLIDNMAISPAGA